MRGGTEGRAEYEAEHEYQKQDVKSETQENGSKTDDYQPRNDYPSAADTVIEPPQEGLGRAVDQGAEDGSEGNRAPAPAELFAHGNDEDAEGAANTICEQGEEEESGYDVPSQIDAGLRTGCMGN